jgi:transcriptional repressor NrdR
VVVLERAEASRSRYVGGVRCPYCKSDADKVVDSRAADDGDAIRRRRECLECGRRYTTFERVDPLPLLVTKRAGVKEPFDRVKLARGVSQAVAGRPIDAETVDAFAAELEEQLRQLGPEVPSEAIGLAVLERLKALDPIAYLRFASVYKGFEDIEDFEREVVMLQKTTAPKPRTPSAS